MKLSFILNIYFFTVANTRTQIRNSISQKRKGMPYSIHDEIGFIEIFMLSYTEKNGFLVEYVDVESLRDSVISQDTTVGWNVSNLVKGRADLSHLRTWRSGSRKAITRKLLNDKTHCVKSRLIRSSAPRS